MGDVKGRISRRQTERGARMLGGGRGYFGNRSTRLSSLRDLSGISIRHKTTS